MEPTRLLTLLEEAREEYKDKSFPVILFQVRQSIGITRLMAAAMAGIPVHILGLCENKGIRRPLTDPQLRGLCEVFGFEFKFLKKKMEDFLDCGHRLY